MWVLYLNDMRSSHIETLTPAVRAESRQQLLDLLERERVESYRSDDGRWAKSFRQGGPLEWFNPPYPRELERQIVDADRQFRDFIRSIPECAP